MKLACKKYLFATGRHLLKVLPLAVSYFAIEVQLFALVRPGETSPLVFGALWAVLLSAVALQLPRLGGRIFFGITYFLSLLWEILQSGYYTIFDRMLWVRDLFYADEGADYIGDVLNMFPFLWWIGGVSLIGLGVLLIVKFPQPAKSWKGRTVCLALVMGCILGLCFYPKVVFLKDRDIWGTRSEYAQSSSYRATYNTMYDARNVYNITGIYQLLLRDIWKHQIYPLTPAYRALLKEQTQQLDEYFSRRPEASDNEMTGVYAGKNVVMVLMESMDDWMITPEDTPTLYRLMSEGINFTDFYTPGYGTARTINSEFCMNTGIYLPTNGDYVFDYVTNSFDQAIAAQATANGYTAEVFHYNNPEFYSRGAFEPAMGYNAYNSYEFYESDTKKLYDEDLVFDIPELHDLFFREGLTFNTVITRSAHLSYKYNEVLSHYALKEFPEYKGKYGSEEEDCARVKAKLVDDFFTRLLEELEAQGQLENTVILAMTDHYTYGYLNMDELYAHSGVTDTLLLEKTPCFTWTPGGPAMEVTKTLNTADFVPTMLNLLGIDSPYNYLGQDAFDSNYEGYALFPNGSWICGGIVCDNKSGKAVILQNTTGKEPTPEFIEAMNNTVNDYIHASNLLLTCDYYKR